ncbi:FMN-binding negative transcriptional regulator [Bacillus sp. ISL-46]|uniref:FMN-binding negative transcriptional regulator n=1 Tax=Bacillus sp. ISL-46 TaxID=2819129 RepID=UPI002036634E|nr:FMN-binding negative transcriptional regulator [Bacillus sp. ISL-46]
MMKSYPFALLITVDEHRPLATHIPLEIREDEGKIYATGTLHTETCRRKLWIKIVMCCLFFKDRTLTFRRVGMRLKRFLYGII